MPHGRSAWSTLSSIERGHETPGGALFLAGAGLALSTWAAVACTTADVRFSDFQFRRVSVTGVAITGEVINDCAEPVWGIIRLSFRNKRGVVDTQAIWPAGRHTIPPKSAYPVSWYFDIDPTWTTLEHKVVMVDPE